MSRASRYRVLAEHATSRLLQRGMLPARKRSRGGRLILIFNTMWGDRIRRPRALPAGFELSTDLRRFREARAVVFHLPSLGGIDRLRKPPGQLWVGWWMECDHHFPRLADAEFMRRFDLTMSHRLEADVFTPYFDLREYDDAEQKLRAEPRPKHSLAVLFMSGKTETSGRTAYAAELMRHLPVDSYGRLLPNRRLSRDRGGGGASMLETIAGSKFTLAFENAIADDYVTEKLYDPLVMGSVPVYLGAPNIDRLVPSPDCYMDVRDFAGPEELADHLLELDADDDAYQRHHAWRREPYRPEFQGLLDIQRKDPLVRLCELVGRLDAASERPVALTG